MWPGFLRLGGTDLEHFTQISEYDKTYVYSDVLDEGEEKESKKELYLKSATFLDLHKLYPDSMIELYSPDLLIMHGEE